MKAADVRNRQRYHASQNSKHFQGYYMSIQQRQRGLSKQPFKFAGDPK